jgi:RNA recognition motif-containing protein
LEGQKAHVETSITYAHDSTWKGALGRMVENIYRERGRRRESRASIDCDCYLLPILLTVNHWFFGLCFCLGVSLFITFLQVLEVVALRKDGLRGQAFVIFDDVASATEALQKENGLVLFGKPLHIAYAREKSDRISKRDGSFIPKAKRVKVEKPLEDETVHQPQQKEVTAPSELPTEPPSQQQQQQQQQQELQQQELQQQPPSHILFASDLPSECNEMMLAMLFRQYSGFKEVRIAREGLAFIEFDNEPHATVALQRLNGFQLTTNDVLTLNYGKA